MLNLCCQTLQDGHKILISDKMEDITSLLARGNFWSP